MDWEAVDLERRVKAAEFKERWEALGFDTRPKRAAEVGVSEEAIKTWETITRPIPRYAWRALERIEAARKRRSR